MKKIILLSNMILATLLFGCKHEKSVITPNKNAFKTQQNAAAKIVQTAASCACLTQSQYTSTCLFPALANTIITQFMGGQITKTFTITWSLCYESPYNAANNTICNTPYSGVTSTLILCYFNCNVVTAHFLGKPPCAPCMPNDFCLQLIPGKSNTGSNTYYTLQGNYDLPGFDNVTLQIVVSSDPDVVINCVTNPNDPATQVNYSCNGHF